jgi:SAM-dependent methyltransferase
MSYDRGFYDTVNQAGRRSAEVVLPHVLSLMDVDSAIDIGCGTGIWTAVLHDLGVADVLGVDGAYVPEDQRRILPDRFLAYDISTRIDIPREFDLCLCLEVAEHLPASRADGLIADLVALAPAVLFSAAAPDQGGTAHVNEQWPDYWIRRFEVHGWTCWDLVRPLERHDPEVAWIYRQNIMVALAAEHPLLARLASHQQLRPPLDGDVAFEYVARYILEREPGTKDTAKRLLGLLRAAATNRIATRGR